MNQHIAAHTPADDARFGAVVPFVNVSRTGETYTITVRERGGDLRNPTMAAIEVSGETLTDMLAEAVQNLPPRLMVRFLKKTDLA